MSGVSAGYYTAYVYGDDGSSLTNGLVQSDAGFGMADTSDFNYPTLTASLTVTQVSTTTSINLPALTYNASGTVTVTVTAPAGTPTGNVSLGVDNAAPTTAW